MSELFSPIMMGKVELKNRIALPPLTRCRSSQPGNIPNDLMVEYYTQRASAGFMVTEGTQIEPRGQGYAWTPGIHSNEQIENWKKVTESVHTNGGVIFCQLWHVGRVSHVNLQPNGEPPIAPSAIQATNVKVFIETEPNHGILTSPSVPRELSIDEIQEVVKLYKKAAQNAKDAGFDGVELHCANGYLVNQFISTHTNKRSDIYGGSLENRLRFLKEIVTAVSEIFGSECVGVRFAPLFDSTTEERVYLGLVEEDPHHTYIEAAKLLQSLKIGYLSIAEADWDNAPEMPISFREELRKTFTAPIMYSGKYTLAKAQYILDQGWGDLFGFGRGFIANPDLPARLKNNWPLNELDVSSMYGGTEKGYTSYPFYE